VLGENSLTRIVLQQINSLLLVCLLVSQFQLGPLTSFLKSTHELCPAENSSNALDQYAQKGNAFDCPVVLPTETPDTTNTPATGMYPLHSTDWLYPFFAGILLSDLPRPPPFPLLV
jgi:hypothetical protein